MIQMTYIFNVVDEDTYICHIWFFTYNKNIISNMPEALFKSAERSTEIKKRTSAVRIE